jgi:hypothetical protein
LAEGASFLFSPIAHGRLELIPGVNLVASIGPSGQSEWSYGELLQIPKRVTQLTIQQAEVVWVGTWDLPGASTESTAPPPQVAPEGEAVPAVQPTATPEFVRTELRPDIIILSMTPQDALALKWAMDRGVDIDLALRSQGDTTAFATTSISLPQLVDQGGLTIPDRGANDLNPRADEVEPPSVPPLPPGP